ncbi:MAG: hypothetical protein IJH39_07300 [Clostridia bacterium]|nr:hypothetical protein [Clostridia bacterium]
MKQINTFISEKLKLDKNIEIEDQYQNIVNEINEYTNIPSNSNDFKKFSKYIWKWVKDNDITDFENVRVIVNLKEQLINDFDFNKDDEYYKKTEENKELMSNIVSDALAGHSDGKSFDNNYYLWIKDQFLLYEEIKPKHLYVLFIYDD